MMKNVQTILLFLVVNAIGFSAASICYYIGYFTGAIPIVDEGIALEVLRRELFQGTMIIWLVCALFSIAFFFIKGHERYAFLVAPALIPIFYGLSTIY